MRNTLNIWKLTAGAGLALLLQIGASAAGEHGCFGKCYEQVPAYSYDRTFLRRMEIFQGAYEIAREPSLYGLSTRRVLVSGGHRTKGPVYVYQQKRILIRPYKNIAIYHRARHEYVRERVTIQPESFVWGSSSGGPAYRY